MFGKLAPAVALGAASAIALAGARVAAIDPPGGGAAAKGLTAVAGLTVGHHTLTERPTGCTVILAGAEAPSPASTCVAGAGHARNRAARSVEQLAAGPRDPALGRQRLRPRRRERRDALSRERKSASRSSAAVPIVPAAILIDLGFGGDPRSGRGRLRLPGRGRGDRRRGRRRQCRRRRRRHGGQARWAAAANEGRHRLGGDRCPTASSSRRSSPSTPSATSSIPRRARSSPALATPTARRSPTRELLR